MLLNDVTSRKKIPMAARHAVDQQPAVRLLALLVLAGHLGVVAERELHLLEPVLDVLGHGSEVPALDVGADLDGPRHVLAVDRSWAAA